MKLLKNLLCVMLIACFIFSFAACAENISDEQDTDTTAPVADEPEVTDTTAADDTAAAGFNVTVTDNEGNVVVGAVLQICKDTCVPAVTDENGVAVFPVEVTSEHKLSVLTLPEGYEYTGEAEVYLEDGMTEFEVSVNKVA